MKGIVCVREASEGRKGRGGAIAHGKRKKSLMRLKEALAKQTVVGADMGDNEEGDADKRRGVHAVQQPGIRLKFMAGRLKALSSRPSPGEYIKFPGCV